MENNVKKLDNYWLWKEALPKDLCDLLMKERSVLEEDAAVVATADGGTVDKNIRDSKVCWAPANHWIEGVLYNYGLYACESAGWDFHLGRPEPVQLTAYDKEGFYGWHEDWAPLVASPEVRKISVIALLSDPEDFEGGQFQFAEEDTINMKRGSILAFPSFLRHQVTPVTYGKRYSAVCWIRGPRTI